MSFKSVLGVKDATNLTGSIYREQCKVLSWKVIQRKMQTCQFGRHSCDQDAGLWHGV